MEEKQMKTLGGYEIVDEKAREEIDIVAEKADEALSLAKGATKAFVYDTYEDMISELNTLGKEELLVNYHIMIRTVCVPDLWISGVSDEHVEYTYTSNEDFIVDLTEDGVVQVGHFVLSALETQKVDLSEYVKKTDYATSAETGVVKFSLGYGIGVNTSGTMYIKHAENANIDAKTSPHLPITPKNLDYAVMKALSDSKLEWTAEQKQLARALLGSIGSEDYADSNKTGVVSINNVFGITTMNNASYKNTLSTQPANFSEIDKKEQLYRPIVPARLDYAVKKALSDCKLTGDDVWTDEEKAKALELLGGVQQNTSTGVKRVYGIGIDGKPLIIDTTDNPEANKLAMYANNGCLYTNTPTNDKHATTKKYVDDNFVSQLSCESDDTHLKGLAYIVDKNNEQSSVEVRVNAIGGTVPVRDVTGNIFSQLPTDAWHCANKKYVDDGFVAKIQEADGVTKGEIYTNKYNNVTQRDTVQLDGYNQAGKYSVPSRNSLGGIYIPDEALEDDSVIPSGQVAVNKKYVDERVGSVESILTELHTYAETKIGGEA